MTKRPVAARGLHRRATRWVVGLACAVFAALVPLFAIQYNQYVAMREIRSYEADSALWTVFQLEREQSRLRSALAQTVEGTKSLDPAALNLRFEMFLSRHMGLTENRGMVAIQDSPAYAQVKALLDDFVRRAEPVFAGLSDRRTGMAELRLLLQELREQEEALNQLTMAANQFVYDYIEERNQTIHAQGTMVITLAALQALLLVLFLVAAIVLLRRQQARTEQLRQLTVQLEDAKREADAANEGKSRFLANMSHEIRTPFQGLLGMLNLLDESSLTSRQRDWLGTTRESAQHLLEILNDILDVSTLDSGVLTLAPAPVRIAQLVSEVHELMRLPAADKGLALTLDMAPGLPEWVMADATRVRQILFNLISNGVKFTDRGRVDVRLAPADEGPGIKLMVSDTGVGMDEGTISRLFSRFYQAAPSGERRTGGTGGTGLGLEISRNLARMMGGDITVQSMPGRGTRFTVRLPLLQVDAPAQVAPEAPHEGRSLRVLVVEDHPINLKYLSILLERMGHDAVLCENGAQAVALVRQQPFDVVLMDLHMPQMDGLSATRAIRQLDGPAGRVKIILVTADVINDTREQARLAGVDAFAAKPVQANDLTGAFVRCGLLPEAPAKPRDLHAQGLPQFPVSGHGALPDLSGLPATRGALPVPADPPAVPVLDLAALREIIAMMPKDTLSGLLHEMFRTAKGAVPSLLAALRSGDRQAIGQAAHGLKSTSSLLGFKALAALSGEIEHLTKRTQQPVPPGTAERLQDTVVRTVEALRDLGLTFD